VNPENFFTELTGRNAYKVAVVLAKVTDLIK